MPHTNYKENTFVLETIKGPIDELTELSHTEKHSYLNQLEGGKILFFPQINFTLNTKEEQILDPSLLEPKRKNISYNPPVDRIKGVKQSLSTEQYELINRLMQRFHKFSLELIRNLAPDYVNVIAYGRASFRPVEICTREPLSIRKDDRLLHVDAFPSSPVQDKRILRLFININPADQPRRWRLGESFQQVAGRFMPQLKPAPSLLRHLMKKLKVTKGYRTAYDDLMLKIHHAMKLDSAYQQQFKKLHDFPAGSAWLVYTDVVSHAAMSGQHLLEQTFYLPVSGMLDPQRSPLYQLEAYSKQSLLY